MNDPNEVRFEGRTARSRSLRIGIVIGAAALFVVGAVAAMGASPSPSGGTDQGAGPNASGAPGEPGWGLGRGGMRGMMGGPGMGDGDWQFGGMPGMKGGRGHGPMGQISISAISGSSLSLKTDDGWTRTITVTDATTITRGGQAIKLGDLKVGDTIRLGQTRNADGSFTVTRIEVVVPMVVGTVTNTTSNGFTIKARDGLTRTITTSGTTTFRLGSGTGSLADVKVGATVLVAGAAAPDGSITAITVAISVPRIMGQVSAISGDTITVQCGDGLTTKVNVDAATTYVVNGVTNPGLKDITVGMRILVEGTQNADGSLRALAIHAGGGLGRGDHRGPFQPQASANASGSTTSAG